MSHDRNSHLAHPPHKDDAPPAPEHSGKDIVIDKVQPFGPEQGVVLTSPDVDAEGRLSAVCAQEGVHPDAQDRSPELVWAPVAECKAWCLIVQDPDAPRDEPVLHWAIWNMPGEATSLPAGVSIGENVVTPQDAVQGANMNGQHGWMGPKPPAGHGPHHYQFQLFALAAPLALKPGADLNALTDALKADTLASGLMTATFEVPAA